MAQKKWSIPVEKNNYYTERVKDFTHEGLGVVKVEGYPVFVEGAVKEELIEFKIVRTGKKFSFGKLIKVIEESPDRVEITNKVYFQTGTMSLQHLTYHAQLKFKKEQVDNVLRKIAKLSNVPVFDTIGMYYPYEYRNKAQIPVREIDGKLTTGFFRKHSHDLIPLENFLIQDPVIDKVVVIVRDILRKYKVQAYNEKKHSGDVRHIIVRRGRFTNEIMVVLVTRIKSFKKEREIVDELSSSISNLVGVVLNYNPKKTNVILGQESRVLYGVDYYRDSLLGFTFTISHQSFYQINPIQTEKLYQKAIEYADLSHEDTVIDAYSGIGTMTLALAQKAKHVYGVEIVPQAIENARKNAKQNNVENVSFALGAAEEWMIQQAKQEMEVDALVVDPPRKGLDPSFIEATLTLRPRKMVYVSCNPATLARDLKLLDQGGYRIEKVQPVDMFPQTPHIESVALLKRK